MGRLVSGWAVVTAAMAALLVLAAEANPLLTASLETAPPPGVPDRVVNAETTDLVFVLDSTEALVFDAAAVEASLADLFTPSQPVEALVDFGTHAGGSGPFSYFLTLRNATLSPNGLLVLRAVPGLFFNTEMPPVTNLYSNTVTVCGAPCCANTEWGIQGVVLDSGECRCNSGFRSEPGTDNTFCSSLANPFCLTSYNADDPVLDMDGSLFASGADDRLELSVASPLRPGRQIVSVTVGTTGHPSCSFPGNGFARTHQTAPKCVDRFTGTFALQTLVAFCGIRVEEALSPPIVSRAKSRAVGVLEWNLFSVDVAITTVDSLEAGFSYGDPTVRDLTTTFGFARYVIAPARYSVTGDISLSGGEWDPVLLLVGAAWDFATSSAVLTFYTSIAWPYAIDAESITAMTGDVASIEPVAPSAQDLATGLACVTDRASCTQKWSLTITPAVRCDFGEFYALDFDYDLRDPTFVGGAGGSGGSASGLPTTGTLVLDNIESSVSCSTTFIDASGSVTATLTARDATTGATKATFNLGEVASFRVDVSSADIPVASLALNYVIVTPFGRPNPGPVDVVAGSVTTMGLSSLSFEVYLSASAFPDLTSADPAGAYNFVAAVEISYQDGGRDRRRVRADDGVTPGIELELRWSSIGNDGGGGGGGGGGNGLDGGSNDGNGIVDGGGGGGVTGTGLAVIACVGGVLALIVAVIVVRKARGGGSVIKERWDSDETDEAAHRRRTKRSGLSGRNSKRRQRRSSVSSLYSTHSAGQSSLPSSSAPDYTYYDGSSWEYDGYYSDQL